MTHTQTHKYAFIFKKNYIQFSTLMTPNNVPRERKIHKRTHNPIELKITCIYINAKIVLVPPSNVVIVKL